MGLTAYSMWPTALVGFFNIIITIIFFNKISLIKIDSIIARRKESQ